jgi:energy-converting hydrogenase Eha subunit E
MNKKKQPWSEKVPCISFREPKPNEFGYNNCRKTLLYMDFSFDIKPITWFLGMDEYSIQTMWKPNLAEDFDSFQSYHTRMSGPSSYSDGSFPMDDLSIDLQKLELDSYAALTKDKYNLYGSDWMNTDMFEGNDVSYALITSKLTPESFIAEIRDSLVLKTISSFQAFITSMSHMRYQSSTFSSEKKFCAEFMKNSRFRSISLLEEAKDAYWAEHSGPNGIKVSDLCAIEDDEALQLYSQNTGLSISKPYFIDERYIKSIAVNDLPNGVTATSKVYLGKITEGTTEAEKGNVIRELAVLIHMPTVGKALIKLSFNHDFSIFDLYAVNNVHYKSNRRHQYHYGKSGTINGDAEIALKLLDSLVESASDQVKSEYKEIPGYIPGISVDNIDEFFTRLAEIAKVDPEKEIGSIDVHPFPKETGNAGSWESLLKKTVKISRDKTTVVKISALPNNNYSAYTHNDLDDLEDRINSIFIDYPSLSFRRKSSGSLEERRVGIASKLAKLYSILEPFLIYTLKYSLGSHTIDRPFILVTKDSNYQQSYNTQEYYVSAWHLEHCENAYKAKSASDSKYTFSPKYFLKIVRLYETLESFEELTTQLNNALKEERNARSYITDWEQNSGEAASGQSETNKLWQYTTGEDLSILTKFNWELGNLALDRVLQDNHISYKVTSLEDNIYIKDSISLCLSDLMKNVDKLSGIFQLLMATALELSIENDTFINFSTREKLLTSKDILTHLLSLEARSGSQDKIALKSIYAR